MGLEGGEALVEEMVGEGGVLAAELSGEGLRFRGLRTGAAVGVERVAYDEGVDAVLADKARDGFKVGAQSGAVQGEERLRGEAEGIGQRQADAAVADVQREDASCGHAASVGAPLGRFGAVELRGSGDRRVHANPLLSCEESPVVSGCAIGSPAGFLEVRPGNGTALRIIPGIIPEV